MAGVYFGKPFAILQSSLGHCNTAVKRYYEARSLLAATKSPKNSVTEQVVELKALGRVVTTLCWSLWSCLNRVRGAASSYVEACNSREAGHDGRGEALSNLKRTSRFCIVHVEITTGMRTVFHQTQPTLGNLMSKLQQARNEDEREMRSNAVRERLAGYSLIGAGLLAIAAAILLVVDLFTAGGWLTATTLPKESLIAACACVVAAFAFGAKLMSLGTKEVSNSEVKLHESENQLGDICSEMKVLITELCSSIESARDACRPLQAALAPVVAMSTKLHDTSQASGQTGWEEQADALAQLCRDFITQFDLTYTTNVEWALLCSYSLEVFPTIGKVQEAAIGSHMKDVV